MPSTAESPGDPTVTDTAVSSARAAPSRVAVTRTVVAPASSRTWAGFTARSTRVEPMSSSAMATVRRANSTPSRVADSATVSALSSNGSSRARTVVVTVEGFSPMPAGSVSDVESIV